MGGREVKLERHIGMIIMYERKHGCEQKDRKLKDGDE